MAVDLFGFLASLGRREVNAYDSLSVDEKKSFHPFVALRWLTGTRDADQVLNLNTYANFRLFSTDKELSFKLLALSCTGITRYQWQAGPSTKSEKLALKAISEVFDISFREAEQYREVVSSDDIRRYAEDLGWAKDEIKKLDAELDGTRRPSKSGGKSKK